MSGVTEVPRVVGPDDLPGLPAPPHDPVPAPVAGTAPTPADPHLQAALASRGRVGFAVGIVSERYRLTPDQAWTALVGLSQRSNTRLRLIAGLIHADRAGARTPQDEELVALLNRHWPHRDRPLLPS